LFFCRFFVSPWIVESELKNACLPVDFSALRGADPAMGAIFLDSRNRPQ